MKPSPGAVPRVGARWRPSMGHGDGGPGTTVIRIHHWLVGFMNNDGYSML